MPWANDNTSCSSPLDSSSNSAWNGDSRDDTIVNVATTISTLARRRDQCLEGIGRPHRAVVAVAVVAVVAVVTVVAVGRG